MSTVERRLVGLLIGEAFGEVCQRVALLLLSRGPCTLPMVVLGLNGSGRLAREALVILIHHGLVTWGESVALGGAVVYRLEAERVLLRLLLPMAIAQVEAELGAEAGGLLLAVVKGGLPKLPPTAALEALSRAGWLCATSQAEAEAEGEGARATGVEPAGKRRRLETAAARWWGLDWDRLKRSFLHRQLVSQVERRLNGQVGLVVAAALRIATPGRREEDGTVSCSHVGTQAIQHEVTTMCEDAPEREVGHGLTLLSPLPPVAPRARRHPSPASSSSPVVSPYLEAAGNALEWFGPVPGHAQQLWALDWNRAARRLHLDAALHYAAGRWGAQSARLLRILEERGPLDDKTMASHALLLGTEVRTRLYAMLREGLVHLIEVPRSADHAASRSLHLWSLPPPATRLRLTRREWLLQVIANLLERAQLERTRQAVLVAKAERTDVAAARDTLLTEAEQRQLLSLRRTLWRLHFQAMAIVRDQLIVCLLSNPSQLAR